MIENTINSNDVLLEITFDKKGEITFVNDHLLNLFCLERIDLISFSIFYFLNENQKTFLLKNWSSLFNGAVFQVISDFQFFKEAPKTLLLNISTIDVNRISIKAYDLSDCKEIQKSASVLNKVLKLIGDSNFFYSNLKLDLDIYYSNLMKIKII